jgi:hypothetical protein
MDHYDLDQAAVMAHLEPYLARMYPRFHAALALYNEYEPQFRAEHDDRAAASNIWCHVLKEFQREFGDEPCFHFLELRGLHVLNIRDTLLIRFKKVDEN